MRKCVTVGSPSMVLIALAANIGTPMVTNTDLGAGEIVDLCDVIRDGGTLGPVVSGTGVDHDAAMAVQRQYDEARRQQVMRSAAVVTTIGVAFGINMTDYLPSPRAPRIVTDFDRRQIAAAQAKRLRRAGKRAT